MGRGIAKAAEKVLHAIDERLIVELTQEMVRTETVDPPGDELTLAEPLATRLTTLGFDPQVLPFQGRRANLLCRIPGSGEKPALIMSGHLDTVPFGHEPWEHHPLSAVIADGKIYGRGASDMKGGNAAMIAAAHAVLRTGVPLQGDLILALTAGEEVDSVGAATLIRNGELKRIGALIVAEPSNLQTYTAEKGALWLEALTKGKAAHGSSSHLGKNAITPMADFILKVLRLKLPHHSHPILGGPSLNVATIEGGFKTNVVPDHCRLTLDFRTVPGQEHDEIVKMIEGLLKEAATDGEVSAELFTINNRRPVETSPDHLFVTLFQEAAGEVISQPPPIGGAAYYTDGAVYVPALKVPMVIFGPGDAALAHQVNEWVDIEKLKIASKVYALAALRFLT
ncbi:MAG: M20 family metallopeptidase [candidate division NC10 bacterium]|nr:M20 family metallopeptidase [candidate division NC10 bacterium]